MPHESSLSPRKTRNAARRAEALRLRIEGLTFQEIAQRMGVSRQAVHQLVKRAVEKANRTTQERAEELVVLQDERLNRLLSSVYGKATEGSLQHLEACLKVIDRLNKLHGAEAPTRTDSTIRGGRPVESMSEEELREEARRLGLPVTSQEVNP